MKEPKRPSLELPARLEPMWDDDDPPLDALPPEFVLDEEPGGIPSHALETGVGYSRQWKDAMQLRKAEPALLAELRKAVLDDVATLLSRNNAWRSWPDQIEVEQRVRLSTTPQEHAAAMDAYWNLVDHTWSMVDLEDAARRYCLIPRGFQPVLPDHPAVSAFTSDLLAVAKAIRSLSARASRIFPYHDVDNAFDRACHEHLDPLTAQLSSVSTGMKRGRGRPADPHEQNFVRFWYSESMRRTGSAQNEAGVTLFNAFFRDVRFFCRAIEPGEKPPLTLEVESYVKRVNAIMQPSRKPRAPRRPGRRGR
jgi:hypothetical protein